MTSHRSSFFLVVSLVAITVHRVIALASPATIDRVAIVGSGIAGLSLAHALEGTVQDKIAIYDARPSWDPTAGAGVQLSGGMSVLQMIKPELYQRVADAGRPLESISSRCANWIDPQKYFQLLEFNLANVIRSLGAEELLSDDGNPLVITIMRSALHEELAKDLPVQFNKRLVGISEETGGTMLEFSDGSKDGPFDLVVGCDGVKSAVKQYVNSGGIGKEENAVYSGIRIRYAVQDCKENIDAASFQQYFGNGAYCLTGSYGNGRSKSSKACFTIFMDPNYIGPFKKKEPAVASEGDPNENVDWERDDRNDIQQRMLQQIKDCQVPSADAEPILSKANRFFEIGVYFHNPISLRGWTRQISPGSFVTLCGDSAHAMPPFLGQGANQAVQDAYCLAQKVAEYNADPELDLGALLKDYEKTRWYPTTSITAKSAFLGYLEASSGPLAKFRDLFFFTMDKVGVAKRIYIDAAIPKV